MKEDSVLVYAMHNDFVVFLSCDEEIERDEPNRSSTNEPWERNEQRAQQQQQTQKIVTNKIPISK